MSMYMYAADTAGFDRDAAPSDLQFLTDENIAEIGTQQWYRRWRFLA